MASNQNQKKTMTLGRMGGGMSADKWKLSAGLMAGGPLPENTTALKASRQLPPIPTNASPNNQPKAPVSPKSPKAPASSPSQSSTQAPAPTPSAASPTSTTATTISPPLATSNSRPASTGPQSGERRLPPLGANRIQDAAKLAEDYRKAQEELRKTQDDLKTSNEEHSKTKAALESQTRAREEAEERLQQEKNERLALEAELSTLKKERDELALQKEQVGELQRAREEAESRAAAAVAEREALLRELLDDRRTLDSARSEFEKARVELTKDREELWQQVKERNQTVERMFNERLRVERELTLQTFAKQSLEEQVKALERQIRLLERNQQKVIHQLSPTAALSFPYPNLDPNATTLEDVASVEKSGEGVEVNASGESPKADVNEDGSSEVPSQHTTETDQVLEDDEVPPPPPPPPTEEQPDQPVPTETEANPLQQDGDSFASLPSPPRHSPGEVSGSGPRYIAAGPSVSANLLRSIAANSSATFPTPLVITGAPTKTLRPTGPLPPIPTSPPPTPPPPSSLNSPSSSSSPLPAASPSSSNDPLDGSMAAKDKKATLRGFLGQFGKIKKKEGGSNIEFQASPNTSMQSLLSSLPEDQQIPPPPIARTPKLGSQPDFMKQLMASMQQKHFTFAREAALTLDENAPSQPVSQYGTHDFSRYINNIDQIIKLQRAIRKWLIRNRLRSMIAGTQADRKEKLKSSSSASTSEVENEILATEKTYVSSIYLLIMEFMQPIKLSGLVKDEDVRSIFSNIEVLYRCNSILLRDIEQCIRNPQPTTSIGRIFLNLAPYLKLYVEYVNNYNNAITVLERLKQSKVVAHLFDRLQKKSTNPLFNITFLLVQPIQRIPRYCLLLSELLKRTTPDSSEYPLLTSALEAIKRVADTINESKRLFDQRQKLAEISGRIEGNRLNLVENQRVFIREGPLEVMQDSDTKIRDLHVFLFNDLLLLVRRSTRSSLGGLLKSKPYMYDSHIPLYTAFVSSDEPDERSFRLLYPLCTEGLILIAPTPEEKDAWKSAVVTQVTKLIETGVTEENTRDDSLRHALKVGFMNRKSRLGWSSIYCELKGSTLYVYNSQNDASPWRNLPLSEFVLIPDCEHTKRPWCFKLANGAPSSSSSSNLQHEPELNPSPTSKPKEYVFSLNTQQEYVDWVRELGVFTRRDGLLDVWQ